MMMAPEGAIEVVGVESTDNSPAETETNTPEAPTDTRTKAYLYVCLQALDPEAHTKPMELVVQVGRSQFLFFETAFRLPPRLEKMIVEDGKAVAYTVPRRLAYAVARNICTRQMVYEWLRRLSRRQLRVSQEETK